MTNDIMTVMWKESKGLMRQNNSRVRAALTQLPLVVMVASFLPIIMAKDWTESPMSLIAAVVVPLITVGVTVPESFAGERERHTLDTLLATRLSDQAILYGKLGIGVLYGWVMSLFAMALSLVVVNVVHWQGAVMLFTPQIFAAQVILSLLVSGLMGGIAILVSLRSMTVQGAQQIALSLFLFPIMILQLIPMAALTLAPDQARQAVRTLESLDFLQVALVVVIILLVIDLLLFALAKARFQRSKLSLS